MLIQPSGFELPEDLEVPHSVPGSGSDMASVDINGGFSADFSGVTFQVFMGLIYLTFTLHLFILQGSKLVSWSKCCGN